MKHPLVRQFMPYLAVTAFALLFTFALDAFTNSLDISRYTWDWVHYMDMAENGVTGNPALVSPYAYRVLPPLLAGAFADVTGRSVVAGFRILAYMGVIGQLVMAFALARLFIKTPSRRFWGAFAVMLVIAFSTFNTKFYLFDIFRTDPLAFPLLLLGMYGLCKRIALTTPHPPTPSPTQAGRGGVADVVGARQASPEYPAGEACLAPTHNLMIEASPTRSTIHRRGGKDSGVLFWDMLCVGAAVIGMQAREFCLLPAALLCVVLLRQWWHERRIALLIEAGIAGGLAAAAFLAPRLLLDISRSDQLTDVATLDYILVLWQRNVNIVLGVCLYGLPLWMLITPKRAKRLWANLRGYRLILTLYVLAVIALSFIGGTDIIRFMAYLAPALIICAALIIDQGISWIEIGYMLAAWTIFNRTFWHVPMETIEAYLDFYVVYWDRTSSVTQARVFEAVLWVLGSVVVRGAAIRFGGRGRREAAAGGTSPAPTNGTG